jgi:hypothetical protein
MCQRTGWGIGPRFCNHTTSNLHLMSQADKGRTHIKGIYPSDLATLRLAWSSPRACRGEGNIRQDKKNLNPQVWRSTCWHYQTPKHVEGEGSEEQTKTCRAGLRIEVVKY